MPKNLKTDWKRIGRSGATVDGRKIEPIALKQAAKNYKKDLFTALIWPGHYRWANYGTVEKLKAEENDEGGIDLFAVIAPNDFYLSDNKYGQNLFTSMELMPNFRDTGEWYLTGLAATDNPASAATEEMRFTAEGDKTTLHSAFIKNESVSIAEDEPPGWLTRLFESFAQSQINPKEDNEMTKQEMEAIEKLSAQVAALETKFTAAETTQNPDKETAAPEQPDAYAALAAKLDALTALFTAENKPEPSAEKPAEITPEQFKKLADDLKKLTEDFTRAVNHKGGTDAGEHTGGGVDSSAYL